MKVERESVALVTLVFLTCVLTTLAISPNFSFDPIGHIKQYVFVSFSFALVGFAIITGNIVRSLAHQDSLTKILLCLMVSFLLLNILLHNSTITERIYGVAQRNNGLLVNLGLLFLFLIVASLSRNSIVIFTLRALGFSVFFVALYYLLQKVSLDPFQFQDVYGVPSSTLGNPNFVSGFLGFGSTSFLFMYLNSRLRRYLIVGVLLLIAGIYVILDSNSVQGIFVLGIVLGTAAFTLTAMKIVAFRYYLLCLFLFSSVLIGLGFVGMGPLSSYLQTTTIFSRFDYWRAAIAMTGSAPIFGLGMDSFRDNYHEFRDLVAVQRFGPGVMSDSPHNVFLDYFVAGGIPLGVVHLLLFILGFYRLIRRIFKESDMKNLTLRLPDTIVLSLLSGVVAQLVFSPFQIGISVWAWMLLAYAYTRDEDETSNPNREKRYGADKVFKKRLILFKSRTRLVFATLVFSVSPVMALPPLLSDHHFRVAVESGDGLRVLSAIEIWPSDSQRIMQVIRGFSEGNNHVLARRAIEIGIEFNPDFYLYWEALYLSPIATEGEKRSAKARMLFLSGVK